MARFTPDTLIQDVLVSRQDAEDIFERHGLACSSCFAAGLESIAECALMHEVPVSALLTELNDLPDDSAEEE